MMTKGEKDFIDQYTRKIMVDLCNSQMVHGDPYTTLIVSVADIDVYLNYAVTKKWLSKDGTKVLSGGWATASRFLKR